MTDDRRPTDWADDRLAAAFAARAGGRPTPSDLMPATIDQLRADARPVRARFGFAHVGGAAAAAVVLAVVAVGVLGPRPLTEPGETPGATFELGPTATASATLPSGGWTWPETVLGVPVISVADVRNRLGEFDDTELAIRGWYVQQSDPIRCPPRGMSLRPPEITCPLGSEWLTEDPDRLGDPVSHERRPPAGPALNPVIDPSIPFDVPAGWFDRGPDPLPVVVLAHYGDSRAQSYLERERLVVDALVWRAGTEAPQNPVLLTAATLSATDVATLVEGEIGPARATWVSVMTGARVTEMDANMAPSAPELGESGATWVVRRLVEEAGRPVVRSAYVVDGTNRVWDETWAGAIQLVTTLDVTAGQSAETGAVVAQVADVSRLLTGARAATDAELARADFIERPVPPDLGTTGISVASLPGSDRAILVRWVGGACDEAWRVDVSVYAERGGILVWPRRIVPEAPCDGHLVGFHRSVVLEFTAPTSVEAIEANTNPSGG